MKRERERERESSWFLAPGAALAGHVDDVAKAIAQFGSIFFSTIWSALLLVGNQHKHSS